MSNNTSSEMKNTTAYAVNFDSTFTTSFVINYLDYVVRVLSVFVHLVYIFLMFKIKKFRNRSYFYMHHVIIVSLIYCLHYALYIGTGGPALQDMKLNLIFCYVSEQVWSVLKYIRAFSILLLAFYRLVAVYNIKLYKRLNNGFTFIFGSIAVAWILSIVLTFIMKYSLNTTYSVFFCSPGYSDSLPDMLICFILNIFLVNLMPTGINLWVYLKIVQKLKLTKLSLNQSRFGNYSNNNNKPVKGSNQSRITPNDSSTIATTTNVFTTNNSAMTINNTNDNKNKKDLNIKQIRFAKQFVLMNVFIVLSNLLSVVVDFLIVLATNPMFFYLDNLLWEMRPIVRIFFLVFQSMIPVLSIIYNPEVKFFSFIKPPKFIRNGFLCNSSF